MSSKRTLTRLKEKKLELLLIDSTSGLVRGGRLSLVVVMMDERELGSLGLIPYKLSSIELFHASLQQEENKGDDNILTNLYKYSFDETT